MRKRFTFKQMQKITASQFEGLSVAEKLQVVRYMEQVANRRIASLEKSGLAPVSSALHARSGRKFRLPTSNIGKYSAMEKAYRTRMKTTGEIHKAKKLSDLENRLSQAFGNVKSFLTAGSSTIKGARKTLTKASRDFMSFNELKNASKSQQNKFWNAYNKFKSEHPNLIKAMGGEAYMQARERLFNIMVKKTKRGLRFMNIDQAVQTMYSEMDADYRSHMAKESEEEEKAEKELEEKIRFETLSIFGD